MGHGEVEAPAKLPVRMAGAYLAAEAGNLPLRRGPRRSRAVCWGPRQAGGRGESRAMSGQVAPVSQLKEINGLFAFLLHFADKTVVDFNLLGAGVAFVFYGFMDDNLLDQGIQQFGKSVSEDSHTA